MDWTVGVLCSSLLAPFGLHAMRTYWTDTRDTRIITPLSHTFAPIEPPFPATPGHITASYHVKASGLELVSHGTTLPH